MTAPAQTLPDTLASACRNRLQQLRQCLQDHAIDSLLVSNDPDIRYLTGFSGHDSLLVVTLDRAAIISDPRYDESLDPWRRTSFSEVIMGVRHRLNNSIRDFCTSASVSRLGVQAEHLTVANHTQLCEQFSGVDVVQTTGLVAQLRMCKDEIEIASIEQAIDIQQQALAAALPQLRQGMSELQFCAILECEMKSRGSFAAAFDTMVSTGANSSIIHHTTGATAIEPGTLLIDWGAKVDGYSSDMTRTFAFGSMPEKIREVYNIVHEAQMAAIDACAPGVTCAEVDAVARRIITDAGYGPQFGHGLGHGLGLDTHEGPYFNNLQSDITLRPGMVMTVEPGIYLPGVGGVRIEDDVLITESGARVLSTWPKDLDTMMIEPGTSDQARVAQGMCS